MCAVRESQVDEQGTIVRRTFESFRAEFLDAYRARENAEFFARGDNGMIESWYGAGVSIPVAVDRAVEALRGPEPGTYMFD